MLSAADILDYKSRLEKIIKSGKLNKKNIAVLLGQVNLDEYFLCGFIKNLKHNRCVRFMPDFF